jgi:DnaJ domain
MSPGSRGHNGAVATDANTLRRAGDRDLYALLGVVSTATTDEIAAAFRERAKELHPDRAPDDPATAERFKELSEAYATLTKPERRARYDELSRQRTPAPPEPTTSRAQQFLATPGRARAAVIGGIVCLLLGGAISPVLLSLDTSPDTLGRDVTLWIVVAKLVICGAVLAGAGWWRLAMLRAAPSSSSGARSSTLKPVPTRR